MTVTNQTAPKMATQEARRIASGDPEFFFVTLFRTTAEHFGGRSICACEGIHLDEHDARKEALAFWNGDYPGCRYFGTTKYEWVAPGCYETRFVRFSDDWTFPQAAE